LDIRKMRSVDICSDHHMIMGILRIKAQKAKCKITNRNKYNLKLDDTECQRMLQAKFREAASSLRYVASEGAEESWEGIKTTLQGAPCGFRAPQLRNRWASAMQWSDQFSPDTPLPDSYPPIQRTLLEQVTLGV
jgi:hypothetical protein